MQLINLIDIMDDLEKLEENPRLFIYDTVNAAPNCVRTPTQELIQVSQVTSIPVVFGWSPMLADH